ncbi:hypothetical protein SAMN06265350_102219 [Solitalea koreensis]|uniref:Uncharacterized protein n=1 Tax=Solitalea koreensis TaxID=543615 RepID=A0A521BI28_9SPHI|nr:hypothetical protein SAMN06265350_102219 [Solitalea koreensis]
MRFPCQFHGGLKLNALQANKLILKLMRIKLCGIMMQYLPIFDEQYHQIEFRYQLDNGGLPTNFGFGKK